MTQRDLSNQQYWDEHAASDPLWAVLSFPDKRGGRWSLHEFMKTGEREIALLFHKLEELGLAPAGRSLDFGCGVGRLTQALARRCSAARGADISAVMIELARRLNRYPDRVDYICTAHSGIDSLEPRSFGLIHTNIVLQHVEPELAVRYLHDFFRLLAPKGLLIFQLPSHRDSPAQAEIKPMPDDAYDATIEIAGSVPKSVAASSEFAVTLRIRNSSQRTWEQPFYGPLALGNHWLNGTGELMVVQDDGRSPLLQVVPPGLEWPVLLTMRAPAHTGAYVVEVDVVHEGISWFSHKGSAALRFLLNVAENVETPEAPNRPQLREFGIPEYPDGVLPTPSITPSLGPPEGDFPMNGVARDEVLAIIRAHGAHLAYVEEDRRAGPEWVSYRYFVVGNN